MMEHFGERLIHWYNQNKRDLPWRRTADPYKIWLSEIILQQTRVEQGLAYYNRFIQRFPDIASLARSPQKEIYKLWQGLGYYNRADNLMAAARTIVSGYGGQFPKTKDELLKIKGIGPYTASAIASIAFGEATAVVDGNVYRVLSRVFLVDTPIDTAAGKKTFQTLATRLLQGHDPSAFNQALMEFGALWCKPRNPRCSDCIFAEECEAVRQNKVYDLPVKKGKTRVRNRFFYYLFAQSETAGEPTFLLQQRNGKDIWKNLYEFPLVECEAPQPPENILKQSALLPWLKNTDFQIISVSPAYIHQLSHQKIHAVFIRLVVDKIPRRLMKKEVLLSKESELNQYPVPRLIERYLQDQQIIKQQEKQ